uniref:C2H2-type domain-containing protein n=1 Tax=Culex tarsalis TaxID=7177 RepID=A0A1Q3EXV5_CULTA
MLPNSRLHPSSFVPPYQFATTDPPPLVYAPPAVFNGPFQIIEPGSDLYIETEPNFCLELMPEEGLDTSGGLFLSENGIPAEVLDDVFRLEEEVGVLGRGPVPEGVGLGQYEAQLVAEIERLFPDATASGTGVRKRASGNNSRLAEELTRKVSAGTLIPVVSGSPCYMNVFLKGGSLLQSNLAKSEPPPERGYQCVEMIDGTGTMFKAKYYAEQKTAVTTPARPSTPTARIMSLTKFSPMVTKATTPTRLPQLLKNITPAMASKIESLANGMNRNVTLTPVRTPSRNSLVSASSSTIVIKAPKRTIASGGNATFSDPFFPMPIIKQEPLDDPPQEDPLQIENTTQIHVPAIAPSVPSKQPRKQKLIKLSQNGEVVFNDTSNVVAARRQEVTNAGRERKFVPKVQAPPNNEFVPRAISEPKKHLQRTPTPIRPPKDSRSLKPLLPSPTPQSKTQHSNRPVIPTPPPKRTRYRVHMTQTQLPPQQQHRPGVSKRVPMSQTIESIEILDSSDEEDEEETTTAPESSEPEDCVATVGGGASATLPKLPGNTESIQCPYCCRIFRSSQAVLEHAQNCADASLFRQISKQKKQQQRSQGQSLLKGNCPATIATRRRSPEAPSSSSKTSKKTSSSAMTTKRSERLSIEILPSAFNINNLLQCQACQKSFRTEEHLEQHKRIHQAPIVCEFCKKKFYETPPPKHVCQEKKRSMKIERASRSR